MSNWHPDWAFLNKMAASFTASTPLAAEIASVTPPGDLFVVGFQTDLGAAIDPTASPTAIVIAVDTLIVPSKEIVIRTSGLSIVARSIQVVGGGQATLILHGTPAAVQLAAAEIKGTLAVRFQGSADASPGPATTVSIASAPTPQVITVSAGSPPNVTTVFDTVSVADVMHAPWSVLSLQICGAMAGVVADVGTPEAVKLAASMMRWVSASCHALLAERAQFTTVDDADVGSMATAAAALLTFTQTAASGATYVPVLSADLYQSQANAILAVAQIYDQKITALQNMEQVEQELDAFAGTLASINTLAATPLITTLQALASDADLVETQLKDASLQLQQVGATLPGLQQDLVNQIQQDSDRKLAIAAMTVLSTVATLYVTAGLAVVAPELLAASSLAIAKAALTVTQEIIKAGTAAINGTINWSGQSAGGWPPQKTLEASLTGAQVLASSVQTFGEASGLLWAVVDEAILEAPARIEYAPDFLAKLETMPNLSGFSTGGLDPVTYWKSVVIQTEAAIRPHQDLSAANAYMAAVKLAGTYGSAVGDLQMKLLDLYTRGIATFARLQAVYQAQDRWTKLQASLKDKTKQADAAIGLLERGYLDVKRELVAAVDNYRAAFAYQWMKDSGISVDVTMSYQALAAETGRSIESLIDVLAGTSGGTVRPRQSFDHVEIRIAQGAVPLFTETDGQARAEWAISLDDTMLSGQLGGNTAIFITEATFVLVGGHQVGEVELKISTSGRYENKLNANTRRFVSQPISMNSFYRPGPPPSFISSWRFADPNAYMAPSPYTNWTLEVLAGNWKDVTAIRMSLAGLYLQNDASLA